MRRRDVRRQFGDQPRPLLALDAPLAVLISFNFAVFCGFRLLVSFEQVLDVRFVDSPEAFFDASALFSDTLFRLFSEVSDTFFEAWALFQTCSVIVGSFI